jgi:hypothetical protein
VALIKESPTVAKITQILSEATELHNRAPEMNQGSVA